jgi:hypothetical protein
MDILNLDEEEFDEINEDENSSECPMCTHSNTFLDANHQMLLSKCNRVNLYDQLFELFQHEMAPLRRQNKQVPNITRDIIEEHYTYHLLSYQESLRSDAKVLKQLQDSLLKRMRYKDGTLEKSQVNLWKSLSQYKLSLLKQTTNTRTDKITYEPYSFV